MRAEATIPPFPSLGKGRGDGWPSRHQRRSCRSTLMAASPQPSLAPMKAGVASPLPSPSPSLADANSGKVGRAAESKESHFATLGLAPAAAAPLGQLRRLWCQAKVAKGGPTPPQILSWRGLRQLGFGGGGGPAALSSPSLAREGGRGGCGLPSLHRRRRDDDGWAYPSPLWGEGEVEPPLAPRYHRF